ncbi:MAG TPA: MFS transporter [Woeseiaceae bacterium]|jgi:MFS family permease|nr:MFS transporter [Woeseiaceae bacterium]
MQPPTEGRPVTAAMRRYTMVVLAVVYMFNFIDRYILAILLPAIREEFQVGDTLLGLLTGTAFALFYVAVGIPVARLADKVNRRNLIAVAVAVWSGMTALSGLAANVWQLTLARIGVGIGEAGCSPPAHSMIADLYPPEQRSSAMGFYTLGIGAGIMLAYLAGGWVAQNIGWREALFIVGLPGLLLALIVRFTLAEPARGASEKRRDSGRQPAFRLVMRFLVSRRSFVYMAVGAGLISFVGYSIGNFMPSFIERSYGMELAAIGLWLGLINGTAGGFGFFLGGYLADRVGRAGQARAVRFLALASIFTALLHVGVFVAPTAGWSLVLFVLPALTSNFYLAPVLGQTQSLVSLRMRAVASAIMLLVINVIGLALGPPVTGLISDLLLPRFGDDSMRYALLIVSTILLPLSAWCLHRAGCFIENDLGRADEHD